MIFQALHFLIHFVLWCCDSLSVTVLYSEMACGQSCCDKTMDIVADDIVITTAQYMWSPRPLM